MYLRFLNQKNYLPFYKNIKDEFFGLIRGQEETFGSFNDIAKLGA